MGECAKQGYLYVQEKKHGEISLNSVRQAAFPLTGSPYSIH